MMSGTSADAIDTVLVDLARSSEDPGLLEGRVLEVGEHPWPPALREEILDVLPPATTGVGTWNRLHAQIGEHLGVVARSVLEDHGGVDLVVSHGQTLHHWVEEDGRARGTLQVGDASRIAAMTGTSVLYDLRSADLARGGQGAPLAPVLDVLLLGERGGALLNLGGIANLTIVEPPAPDAAGSGPGTGPGQRARPVVRAGDVGPANALLDAAVRAATGGARHCDTDGRLAASGTVDEDVLTDLLADPFFSLPLPRSTGREHFDSDYVLRCSPRAADLSLPDLLATLTELTARTVAELVRASGAPQVFGSGGGMRNPVLRTRLAEMLAPIPLRGSEELGISGDGKEALLMALLGYLSAHGIPALPPGPGGHTVTGASDAAVLGSLTPPLPCTGLETSSDPAARQPPRRLRLRDHASTPPAPVHPAHRPPEKGER
ncbi:anhydro-N-acetylmuramic acid kinase [Brachybacterium endophyticum]|nr:anhydro-N-acetylmuramic acid kinase [Brachybacterium endophyticum]